MVIDNVTLIFVELAIGLLVAVILGSIAKFFRQPLILAYILAGILISVFGVFRLGLSDVLPLLANFGIVFLLFLVGLELKLSDLKYVGKSAVAIGIAQLLVSFLAGFAILKFLQFTTISAIYLGLALSFSSTIIVIKLLSEKKDLNSLYGKITIGILLIQDLVAILALIFLSGFNLTSASTLNFPQFFQVFAKGTVILLAAFLFNRFILPITFRYTAESAELLLVTALSWCFIFAGITKVAGFSLEIGAFLAGVTIATSPYQLQISARVRPMRDFFTVIFFIFLGANMSLLQLEKLIIPIVILSAAVLLVKPAVVVVVAGLLGQTKRNGFLTGVTLAQISEFSLILVAVGVKIGHLQAEILSLVAAVGIVTIAASSYMIIYSNWLYKKLSKYLEFFELQHVREGVRPSLTGFVNHIILVGAEQVGRDLLGYLAKKVDNLKNIIIVDFNPAIIESLQAEGFNAVYGDISDHELIEELNLTCAKLIISTVPDLEDNKILTKAAKKANFTGPIVATAYWAKDAVKLYEAGADFVLVPELAGGDKVIRILQDHWEDLGQLKKDKSKFLEDLLEKKPVFAAI